MAATQPTLADQIRAQGGDWDIRGIDRAQELADILTKNGITDLSKLSLTTEDVPGGESYSGGGESGGMQYQPGYTNYSAKYGDQALGTLRREGDSFAQWEKDAAQWSKDMAGADPSGYRPSMQGTEGGNVLARSMAGKGAVIYKIVNGPDGKPRIVPNWQSSGEEDSAIAVAKLAATLGSMGTLGGMGMLGDSALAASQGTIFGGMGGAGSGIGSLAGNADKAALFGDLGYGAGMTGAQTAAFDAALAGGAGGAAGSGLSAGGYGLPGDLGSSASITGGTGIPAAEGGIGGLSAGGYGLPGDLGSSELLTGGPLGTFSGAPIEGFATPTLGSGIGAGIGSDPSLLSKFGDWAAANPKLATQLAGLAGGALFGGKGKNTGAAGGMGANPQANFTSAKPAAIQRQYVAPPVGYRPGFDPEHKYFTGIGAVGTGS
jgi:hypothetical protein